MREHQDSPPPVEPDETPITVPSTEDGGQVPVSVDDWADPVKSALARARGIAASTPRRTRRRRTSDARRSESGAAAPGGDLLAEKRGGWSGPAPDDHDPVRVGDVVQGYIGDRGWERPISEARLFAAWADIVGPEVAAHCTPSGLRGGELKITAESTAWATQLRLLSAALLARIVADVGPELVTRVMITGPTGPSWKHGRFSVRGARGPRDTYG